LEISKSVADNNLYVTVKGRLDTMTAPELETELKYINKFNVIVFDFADLDYISSAGLRVLLIAKRQNENIYVENVNDEVLSILDVTGFVNILVIE
jgi:anti-sigma B factor antagonist